MVAVPNTNVYLVVLDGGVCPDPAIKCTSVSDACFYIFLYVYMIASSYWVANNEHVFPSGWLKANWARTPPWNNVFLSVTRNMPLLDIFMRVYIVILLFLHIRATRPLSVNISWFCRSVMSLQHVPSYVGTLKERDNISCILKEVSKHE